LRDKKKGGEKKNGSSQGGKKHRKKYEWGGGGLLVERSKKMAWSMLRTIFRKGLLNREERPRRRKRPSHNGNFYLRGGKGEGTMRASLDQHEGKSSIPLDRGGLMVGKKKAAMSKGSIPMGGALGGGGGTSCSSKVKPKGCRTNHLNGKKENNEQAQER